MRLLIVTQAVDRDDPVLGFFHRWIEEFASQFEKITVICLRLGEHKLPSSIVVHSLGKEIARGPRPLRIVRYTALFLRHIIGLRGEYDSVLVHMNPEYVLLGILFWRLMGKPVYLWYNHDHGGWKTSLASRLVRRVFHTSPFAFTSRFPNAVRMPAGIDTSLFSQIGSTGSSRALYVGRVAPAKRVDTIVGAAISIGAPLDVIGSFSDAAYEKLLRDKAKGHDIMFHGPFPYDTLPGRYHTAGALINLTDPGNYDKVVLEAAACGVPIVTSSPAFDFVEERFRSNNNLESVARGLSAALSLAGEERREVGHRLSTYVRDHESLTTLGERLREEIER